METNMNFNNPPLLTEVNSFIAAPAAPNLSDPNSDQAKQIATPGMEIPCDTKMKDGKKDYTEAWALFKDLTTGMDESQAAHSAFGEKYFTVLAEAENMRERGPDEFDKWSAYHFAGHAAQIDRLERENESIMKTNLSAATKAYLNELLSHPDNKKIKNINARINEQEKANGELKSLVKELRQTQQDHVKQIDELKVYINKLLTFTGMGADPLAENLRHKKRKAAKTVQTPTPSTPAHCFKFDSPEEFANEVDTRMAAHGVGKLEIGSQIGGATGATADSQVNKTANAAFAFSAAGAASRSPLFTASNGTMGGTTFTFGASPNGTTGTTGIGLANGGLTNGQHNGNNNNNAAQANDDAEMGEIVTANGGHHEEEEM